MERHPVPAQDSPSVSGSAAGNDLTFRPEAPDDDAYLLALYASTREAELQLVDWTDDQKRQFVSMQFRAQRTHYRGVYVDSRFDVVLRGGVPVGRLYVDRTPTAIHVIDITVDPALRNQGLGTQLMSRILDEAAATGRAVTIHVERFNPALRLYLRLGFAPVEDQGIYLRLEAHPAASLGQ